MIEKLEIIDNYTTIPFRKIKHLMELRIGMQIQIVDRNVTPLQWKWMVVNEAFLLKMAEIQISYKLPKSGQFVFKDKTPSEIVEWVEPKDNYDIFEWIRVIDIK